jgi:site-specific DNA recombinase
VVALYLRVSTSIQDFELQLNELRAEAEKLGATIFKEYTDTVGGSTHASQRKYAEDVIEDARSGKFQTLLVWRIDRIARDEEYGLNYLRRIEESGCRIKFLTNSAIDTPVPPTPEALSMVKTMRVMLLMGARMQLDNIKVNTRASKTQWIKANKWPATGHVPFGYKLNSDYGLEIVPDRAIIVKRIFRMYIQEDYTIREVVKVLNQEQIPSLTPNGWKKDRIQDMLHNPVYVGALPIKGKKLGFIHTFYCDPIISQEAFGKIAAKTKERSERSKRNTTRDYPFAGLLRCELCGYPLRSMKNGAEESYSYGFTRKPSDGEVIKDKRCSGRGCGKVSQRNLVEALYNDMLKFFLYSSEEEIKNWIKRTEPKNAREDIEAQIKETEAELNLLNSRMERAVELALDPKFEIAKSKFQKVMDEVKPQVAAKMGRIHALKQSILGQEEKQTLDEEMLDLALSIKGNFMVLNASKGKNIKIKNGIMSGEIVGKVATYELKEKVVLNALPLFETIFVNFPKQHLQVHIYDKPRLVSLRDDEDDKGESSGGGNKGRSNVGRPKKHSIVSASANSSNTIWYIYKRPR